MLRVHSRFRYAGPPRFGGALRPGDEVLHLVSDAQTAQAQRAELRRFVAVAGLPRSLLGNPHFLGSGRPHLDVWGRPARKAARALAQGAPGPVGIAALGRNVRNGPAMESSQIPRTSTCIPGEHEHLCVTDGRRGAGAGSEGGMAKRKPEHTCEVCRTLGDLVDELNPDIYVNGPEFVVGHALRAAIQKHVARVGRRKEKMDE